jgi:hypothetical protein
VVRSATKKVIPLSRRREQPAPLSDPSLLPVAGVLGTVLAGLYLLRLTTDWIGHPTDHAIGLLFWGVLLLCSLWGSAWLQRQEGSRAQRFAALVVMVGVVAAIGLILEVHSAAEGLHAHNIPDRMFEP